MAARLIRWSLASAAVGAIVIGVSGQWRDPWLWTYVALWSGLALYAMFAVDEDLARERFHPPEQGVDSRWLRVIRIVGLTNVIVAALDGGRWHLTHVAPSLRAIGMIGLAASGALVIRAMMTNRFFSTVVRIQHDRGHRVIDDGPYAIVRHPGYAGMILFAPMSALALGSWLAFAIGLAFSALVVRRVLIEDRFLQAHLTGYPDYARRVTHRLVPRVF